MGLQWCPRDPLVRVNDQVIGFFGMIPIQYQNRFDEMKFRITVPKGAKTEVLYIEDQATVEFVEESGQRSRGEMEITCEFSVTGNVPADAIAQLFVVAPWHGSCQTFTGEAGGLTATVYV